MVFELEYVQFTTVRAYSATAKSGDFVKVTSQIRFHLQKPRREITKLILMLSPVGQRI